MSDSVTQNGFLMAEPLVNYESLPLSLPPRLHIKDETQLPGTPEISQQSAMVK